MKNDKLTDKSTIKQAVQARADAERKEYAGKDDGGDKHDESPYFISKGYLCRTKYGRDGEPTTIRLCNFSATITEENIIDDGRDITHFFCIDGKMSGKHPLPRLEIPAANFSGMSWVPRWGSKPCLEPGQTVKDFVRHAIQTGSNGVKVVTHYAHTGWREIGGEMVYLHTGGAIGGVEGISVRLSQGLDRYALPPLPPNTPEKAEDGLRNALNTSLSFLEIGNRAVTVPLFALAYLSPLTTLINPMPNFSMYLYGSSGTFKTTTAILALSHFGSFNGVESLSSFDDTVGNLEKRSFTLKDTLHIVDDYHPSAHKSNAQIRENTVQRLIRNYSNRTARGRLNSDLTEKGRYEPRGMLLLTAEELPTLESTLARVCIIEVKDGEIDKKKMSELQAKANLLPFVMTAYLQWVRDNMAAIKATFPGRFVELRQMAAMEGLHKKLPEQAAFMRFALETVVSFFHDQGVLSESQGNDLVSEGWEIFRNLSEKQQQRIKDDDPIMLFKEIFQTLIHQKNARLENKECSGIEVGGGDRVGFYDRDFIYLIPQAAWHAMLTFCVKEGTHFPFSKHTFFQMLRNRKIIAPGADGKNTAVVNIAGKSMRLLKITDRGLHESAIPTEYIV